MGSAPQWTSTAHVHGPRALAGRGDRDPRLRSADLLAARAGAGFKVDLVKPTDHRPRDDFRPPSDRDPRRRCGEVLAPDGSG